MQSKLSVKYFVSYAIVLTAVLSTSCGGGGSAKNSDSETPDPSFLATRTLSGVLSIAANSAVDSDTNNPEQPNRASNNTGALAQKLLFPFALVGSVNLANAGPQGPNLTPGDEIDLYKVALQAGQVVELEFTADTQTNDIDLGVSDDTGTLVGESAGPGNAYECVRVTKTANYVIGVFANKGASIYNMRVNAPNANTACTNATALFSPTVAGQLVTKRIQKLETLAVQAQHKAQTQGDVQMTTALRSSEFPVLLQLPSARADRVSAMVRVSTLQGGGNALRKSNAWAVREKETEPGATALLDALDTTAYAKQLMATGQFEYAEPNRLLANQASTLVGNYPPNDPLYANQRWHYDMIDMPAAMQRLVALSPQPTHRPLVAVIDSGIVADHPDLEPQIEHQASFTKSGTFSNNASDLTQQGEAGVFHGSHVAGTIAAATFDGVGAAAVAPMAKLMPINVFAGQYTNTYDVSQSILYAAGLPNSSGKTPPRRADVINLSVGSLKAGPCSATDADVIARARAAGVLVVASSGNESASTVYSPANCPGVISVGAVGASRQKAAYSNTGEGLVVVAPGGDSANFIFSTTASFNAQSIRVPDYAGLAGTSMAAPHVAGILALMRFAHPQITPDQVTAAFTAGQLTNDIGNPGYDTIHGFGLINARKAVDVALALKAAPPAPTPDPAATVLAQPTSIDLGNLQTSADLTLLLSTTSNEKVNSVISTSPAVTITAKQIDPNTRLGTYTITVNRATLAEGESLVNLRVTTSTARQFTVPVRMQKTQVAPGQSNPNVGPLYVLLRDANTFKTLAEVRVLPVNGRYAWAYTGSLPEAIQVLAGTDIDNNKRLCAPGEACGAFPTLGSQPPTIYLQGNRNDINFSVTTFGGFSVGNSVDSAIAPWQGFERLN